MKHPAGPAMKMQMALPEGAKHPANSSICQSRTLVKDTPSGQAYKSRPVRQEAAGSGSIRAHTSGETPSHVGIGVRKRAPPNQKAALRRGRAFTALKAGVALVGGPAGLAFAYNLPDRQNGTAEEYG